MYDRPQLAEQPYAQAQGFGSLQAPSSANNAYAANSAAPRAPGAMDGVIQGSTSITMSIQEAANRAEILADRLFGPVPTSGTMGAQGLAAADPSAAIGVLQMTQMGASNQLGRLFAALSRLEDL